jgi:tetratricopeptide (TPR) repeat protein
MKKSTAKYLASTLPLICLLNSGLWIQPGTSTGAGIAQAQSPDTSTANPEAKPLEPSATTTEAPKSDAKASKPKKTAKSSSKSSRTAKVSSTGLEPKALQLANSGDWNGVVERLQTATASDTTATSNHGWLAFAYLFLGKCDQLKELSAKTQALPVDNANPNAAKIVELYNLTCQGKFDDAEKASTALDGANSKDVLLNLALAAVAAKKGNPAGAVTFVEKVTAEAPDFSWGYRTLGFIQDRSLKTPLAAEASYFKALAIQPNFKEVRDLLVDNKLARNDFDGAIEVAKAAIKAAPQDANNYYRLSQIYTQQWRLKESTAELDKAIKLSPNTPRFYRAKAAILRYQGDLPNAIATQQKAVDFSTEKAFELIELAALNELAGNETKAADILRQSMDLSPKNQAAHQKLVSLLSKQKRWEDLDKEYRRALVLEPKSAALHLGLANVLLKQNKTDDAINEFKEASNLDGNDPRPHRQLGTIYLDRKDYGNAAKAYTRALNINPGSVEDLVALGYTYAQNDDFMQAETAFVTALALQQLTHNPGSNRYDVMRSLAVLLLTEGRYSEAATNLEAITASEKDKPGHAQDAFLLAQAKAMRDRSSNTLRDLGTAFDALPDDEKVTGRPVLVETYLKLGKPELAAEQISKLTDTDRAELPWQILQARTWRMKGDLAKAEELANAAVASNDQSPEYKAEALIEQAQVQFAKANNAGAETTVRKALDVYPKSFAGYELLGKILLKKGDHEHAIEAGKHALEINPYFTPAYLLTGDAYVAANKFDEAANNYKRAVELYPAWLDAHRALRDIYKKLAQKEDAQKEDEIITQIEKRS